MFIYNSLQLLSNYFCYNFLPFFTTFSVFFTYFLLFLLSINMPNSVLVSGITGVGSVLNGVYYYFGENNGKPRYIKDISESPYIIWDESYPFWIIQETTVSGGDWAVISYSDAPYPWLATNWIPYEFLEPGVINNFKIEEILPSPIDIRNAKYATVTEAGSARFRRLFAAGYL